MTDYSNQDITGLNLSNQNLTGADFTNANATNVNFTNAIITNAIFKNTLITGATLTGITFSDLQKGHLLLRAANHTNSAVNNLTSLTPAEFRIIQPAVGTDTIARISTVTVKIPNSQGEGFTVSVTPVISQLVCIFVATSQNIIITTGGTQIRTIRSNGTVVQDVSNGNTTLNYLKIDSISYRLTVGNGDGVIAMIPVDLNVYQVNGSGLGDIVSLNVGSASTTLNMNNNGITNVSSIQGWNVKEITAGTGIGVTATNGSYAITNSAVVRDISAGTGITVSTTNGVGTITNTGPTQVAVAQTIRDENQALYEVGALPRKPDYWATNWSIADNTARNQNDMYVSVDGKIIASASPVNASTGSIRYSTDYGTTFGNGNVSLNWQTICGTSQGSRLFAISSTFGTPSSTTLYQSTDQGANWTQITSPGFASDAYIHRMRCSGDGTYLTATDLTANLNGRYYTSSNSGTTWTARTLSASAGYTHSLCFSRSGSIQYITWRNPANTDSKIFRSFDYGVTFSEVFGHLAGANWRRIECDATGRYVWATRYDNINNPESAAWYSHNYGSGWNQATGWNSIEEIWVSATAQFVVGVSVPNPYISNNRYLCISVDYGQNTQYHVLGNTTTFRTINGSADGSVLVLGSVNFSEGSPSYNGDGFIRVARQGRQNIQDLQVTGAGALSKVNGIYSLNITSGEELWYSGITNATTDVNTIYLDDFSAIKGKINLTEFDIRYEIDVNWNLPPTSAYPTTFINLGINSVQASSVPDTTQNNAQTMWTNAQQPQLNTSTLEPQVYTSRFFCGYSGIQGTTWIFRYRTTLSGKISLTTRTNAQYANDINPNSRLIRNDFVSNSNLLQQHSTPSQFFIYPGLYDVNNNQNTIRGYALWETSYENLWNDLNSGVFRLYLRFTDEALNNRSRGAEVKYSIYRVRK
jgi:hypothetical protein